MYTTKAEYLKKIYYESISHKNTYKNINIIYILKTYNKHKICNKIYKICLKISGWQ